MDGDGQVEVVSGGSYFDGVRDIAQMCIWSGSTLGFENVRAWYWTGNTSVQSIAVANVEGSAIKEMVSGGYYTDSRLNSQLIVWSLT